MGGSLTSPNKIKDVYKKLVFYDNNKLKIDNGTVDGEQTYAGWNFDTIWDAGSACEYPRLRWQNEPLQVSCVLHGGSSNSTSVDLYTAAVNSVKSFSAIEYAPEYNVLYVPNDTLQFYPNYSMDLINAYDAWDITHGSSNVVIGISDQNFEVNHEELIGKVTYYDTTNTALSTHGTSLPNRGGFA